MAPPERAHTTAGVLPDPVGTSRLERCREHGLAGLAPLLPSHLDRRCPTPSGILSGVRTKHYIDALRQDTDHLIAYFGDARLVRSQAGRLEVQGGTEADHADAWHWAQRFLTPPPVNGRVTTAAGGTRRRGGP